MTTPKADRSLQQRRFRLASIAVAAALLLAVTIGLRQVTREISEEMASALATQRVHIEKVSEVERLARATHIEMVERWLLPFTERARREHDIEDRVAEVRRAADDFGKLSSIDAEERAVVSQLLVAVAIWTNRVDQAVVAADGPLATHELRRYLDDVGQHTRRLIEVAARAGSSTDRRVVQLRRQQAAIQVVFVLLTLGILGLAVGWSRGKELADERYRVSEQARRLQETETRKRAEFFAGMSDELRRPLETILGFARTLGERSSVDPLLRDGARQIHSAAQDLFGIINNILDSAKLESGHVHVELAPVSLPDLFERCVQRCEGLVAQRRVEVVCETPPRLPKVRADFAKLQQVFSNLLAHAIEHTEGGRVTLRAWADGRAVHVELVDTSPGLPPEVLERLWHPFEQPSPDAPRKLGGAGLGLSIARGLVELLGGRIRVRSIVGQGTTFTVTLQPALEAAGQLAS